MNNKMNDLSAALTAAGVGVKPSVTGADVLFTTDGFGIFCSLTGRVQARNVRDSQERFGLGTCEDSAETLAAAYVTAMASF